MLKEKLLEWGRRYWLAETLSFAAALLSSHFAYLLSGNLLVSAFLTTWVTNGTFYGTIAWQEMGRQKQKAGFGLLAFLKALRIMVLEFGPGEYLDSLLIRPFWLAALPLLLSDYAVAIAVGTVLADISYFAPVIFSYEMRKKYLGE